MRGVLHQGYINYCYTNYCYTTVVYKQDAVFLQKFMNEKKCELEKTTQYIEMRELMPVSKTFTLLDFNIVSEGNEIIVYFYRPLSYLVCFIQFFRLYCFSF